MQQQYIFKAEKRELFSLETHGAKGNLLANGLIRILIGIILVQNRSKESVLILRKKTDFLYAFDVFVAEFRALTVAEVDDNASYVYKSVKDR